MDTKYEDNILSQIEKNLSSNINENLFLTGRVFEGANTLTKKKFLQEHEEASRSLNSEKEEYPLVSKEHISEIPPLSRAELIRQAREACLKQLNGSQTYSRPYEPSYISLDNINADVPVVKKEGHFRLFANGPRSDMTRDEASPQEIAAFRSLIIRTVCAVILFLSLFIIDKFDLKIGNITNTRIKEYITGNDALKALEDMIVAWLK
ncbi:MAG: hypothetical protein GX757_00820 [Clostridiales bacterium]|nr:hypothetical protein [Clostridiales bacterium]